jgi:hypothetical protein
MRKILLLFAGLFALLLWGSAPTGPIRPGNPEWPVAWISYRRVDTTESDFADLKAHGVGLVETGTGSVERAKEQLAVARRFHMKYAISLPEITESAGLVRQQGLTPVDALMIGGVYQGQAIDRHLFHFSAAPQRIAIEPPVYDEGFAYTAGSGGTGPAAKGEPIGHYFPGMGGPLRAEIVVPLKKYDGRQHLKIVPATIEPLPAGSKVEQDSVRPGMQASSETANRKLYQIRFDLTGLDTALLDQVGIAVYWPNPGTRSYWMFGQGDVSAAAESTQEALRRAVRETLKIWTGANDGAFPLDTVLAARFGDECFYVTGHTSGAAPVGYPLWEYSEPSIAAFHAHAKNLEYPRTWGFPEIYGPDAYGWWLYTLHEQCARLAGIIREEIAGDAPGLLLFRNTTRAGIFSLDNDHDGSGPELLTRNLDIVHLDPYPYSSAGYAAEIPRDMSYYAGLARRYHRLLVPWMQAHVYSNLVDPGPEIIDRMAEEQWRQGPDAVMWLGYGNTFPKARPDSWERAAAFHRRLMAGPPPKPVAKLAVLRGYVPWALSGLVDGAVRNPADWMLQQVLEVWAVQHGQPYDVYELPPTLSPAEVARLSGELKRYAYVVSTIPWKGAWVVGHGTDTQTVAPGKAKEVQAGYEVELKRRGWL